MAYPDWVERQRRPGTNISCIRGKYYLYEATSVWNKEKGRAQKKTGKYLGRITEDGLIPPKQKQDKVQLTHPTIREYGASSTLLLNEKWGKQYPSAVRVWNDNFVYVQRLFEYPAEIRKMIYTTNAIESFNSALRKVTDRKAAFPNEMAVMKILYLRTPDVIKV